MHIVQFVDSKTKQIIRENILPTEQAVDSMVSNFENTGGKECVLFSPDSTVYKTSYFTNTRKGKLHKVYFRVHEHFNFFDNKE